MFHCWLSVQHHVPDGPKEAGEGGVEAQQRLVPAPALRRMQRCPVTRSSMGGSCGLHAEAPARSALCLIGLLQRNCLGRIAWHSKHSRWHVLQRTCRAHCFEGGACTCLHPLCFC
jgi:hypothetical protein